ncbi:autophagy protein 6 [Tulasnella sp. 419]|nr:autophagy protein 6 [Tulasnella sp. 418]KAG8970347.1 autophagy protein 6 [Tulasnella sp. 419]
MATFVCQQCKQSLQLDPSLEDITHSAHDMIAASLPKYSHSDTTLSSTEKFARLNVSPSLKSAIQQHSRTASSSTSKTASLGSHLPAESFIFLQDSVVGSLPSVQTPKKSIPNPMNLASGKRSVSAKSIASPKGQTVSSPKSPTFASSSPAIPSSESQTKKVIAEPPPPPRAPPHKLSSALRLFTLLSSRTELDHPLCAECTHVLLDQLQKQLEETKKERDGYIAFERDIKRQKEAIAAQGSDAEEKAKKRIEQLKIEESKAIEELRAAEQEKNELEAELADLQKEEKGLEEEESEFWTSYSASQLETSNLKDTLTSLEHQYATLSLELSKLSRTNVHNDAFCIGHDGVFGTINGLRLGKVPGVVVEWSEINAAWGMTLLLLSTIARKVGFTFENYKLIPMGSFSKIERTTGDKAVYELYGSGDIHLARILHNRRFDMAMVAFLDCLRQLMEYAKSQDPRVEFPQQVSKDKIGEASIKYQFGQDDSWTRALRHVLLALKLLLKWATNG